MAVQIALPKKRNINDRRTWHGMAFIMEALLLMVFLILSITVLIQLFSASRTHNQSAYALSYAVVLASSEAERFTADPRSDTVEYFAVEAGTLVDADETNPAAFKVTRTIEAQQTESGTLFYADIKVEQYDEIVYELDSARFARSTEVSS